MQRTHPYNSRGGRGRSGYRGAARSSRGISSRSRPVPSAPSAAFGPTLQFITTVKLQELEKQLKLYQNHFKVIEHANAVAGDNLLQRVEILYDAVRSWPGSGALDAFSFVGSKLSLSDLKVWLLQAKKDPSFSSEVMKGWIDTLETHIRHSLTRFECAKLFGNLFNEWIASGDSVTAAMVADASSEDVNMPFVEVERKEMHEQKEQLASIIFETPDTDSDALSSYLADLFSSGEAASSLNTLRHEIEEFGRVLDRTTLTAEDVRWTIKSLLASDLMGEEKRTTLREFYENSTVLDEVASVLNMRLASLGSWTWPANGVVIEMRRHLNGKYRAYTDPEILDALFLQYLGVKWQVKFKEVFRAIYNGMAWKRAIQPLSKAELDRRLYFLQENSSNAQGIEAHRRKLCEDHFLVGQLRSSVDVDPTYDDDINAPAPNEQSKGVSATAIKQKLLHLMTTECYLDMALHERHTVVRTDLEWFGPSLPHKSILALLEFFGVSQHWLHFFEAFLEAPLRFKEDSELRTRKRGTPISYALSALCGEVILFAMDFAVNQKSDGLFLYRIHDDLWFWDANPDKCVRAWKEMNRYASLVGLKFNESKTGTACVGGPVSPELPPGDIRWGFLKFDSDQARFVIDQQDVDLHVIELRRQLAATKSVFGWVNAYNKYMAFFVRNFGGRPAECFGRAHVDDVIETLARIQRELFPGADGGAVGHLKTVIRDRFGVDDLPEGYFYASIGSGGLEVRNPMIEQFAMRSAVAEEPERAFLLEMSKDAERYQLSKEAWQKSSSFTTRAYLSVSIPPPEFMSFEDYVSQRETRLADWRRRYVSMMEVPPCLHVDMPPMLQVSKKWWETDFYEKWVVSLYGDELVKRFGSLDIVDRSLIPVGMLQLFRTSRMKWEQ